MKQNSVYKAIPIGSKSQFLIDYTLFYHPPKIDHT